jgi:hypothetical protein
MNCCVQRVSDVDPNYSFGQLLARISQQALPPMLWDEFGPAKKCNGDRWSGDDRVLH